MQEKEIEAGGKTSVSWINTASLCILIALVMTVALRLFGRVWWCKLGDWAIYVNEAWNSSHTSQHVFDPYTFTHVLHGVLGFWIASVAFKKLSFGTKIALVAAVEAAWEVLENSNYIIQQYRENTASLDYFGDSIANSSGDLVACVLGFLVATKLGMWKSLAFFVFVELALMLWIRDGFLLNVLMLIYPLDWIKNWQLGI